MELPLEILEKISADLQIGDDESVAALTRQAVDDGVSAKQILNDGLIAGMNVIGRHFKAHEIFLPDVLMAAKAMNAGVAVLKPLLASDEAAPAGKVVLGSVLGDVHDIGKNLVAIMLRGTGFEVIDLGYDVSPERFIEAARDNHAKVIGMSALLTTTMPGMQRVIDMLKEQNLADGIKTIVGGAPVSAAFANEIGADAYGFDASSAVDRIKTLVDGQ